MKKCIEDKKNKIKVGDKMKKGVFLIILFINLINIKAVVLPILVAKDSIKKNPIICYDEIKNDSLIVLNKDTVFVSLYLHNTKNVMNKFKDSTIEYYCERELLIEFFDKSQNKFRKVISKDDLVNLFKDTIGKDFLNRSLMFYTKIKEVQKDKFIIFLSLSEPDTDYINDLNICISKNGTFEIKFDESEENDPI